jgi:hypothetical protein
MVGYLTPRPAHRRRPFEGNIVDRVRQFVPDIGNFRPKRILDRFEPASLVGELDEIVLHEGDEPDAVPALLRTRFRAVTAYNKNHLIINGCS